MLISITTDASNWPATDFHPAKPKARTAVLTAIAITISLSCFANSEDECKRDFSTLSASAFNRVRGRAFLIHSQQTLLVALRF
jgi:hypothetical protein